MPDHARFPRRVQARQREYSVSIGHRFFHTTFFLPSSFLLIQGRCMGTMKLLYSILTLSGALLLQAGSAKPSLPALAG